jgi:hypothetical protein
LLNYIWLSRYVQHTLTPPDIILIDYTVLIN